MEQPSVRSEAIYVGIDVSKDRLDGHVRPSGEVFVAGRDAAGLEELVARLERLAPALVVVEATGGYETVVASALAAAGLALAIVNPRRIRKTRGVNAANPPSMPWRPNRRAGRAGQGRQPPKAVGKAQP